MQNWLETYLEARKDFNRAAQTVGTEIYQVRYDTNGRIPNDARVEIEDDYIDLRWDDGDLNYLSFPLWYVGDLAGGLGRENEAKQKKILEEAAIKEQLAAETEARERQQLAFLKRKYEWEL